MNYYYLLYKAGPRTNREGWGGTRFYGPWSKFIGFTMREDEAKRQRARYEDYYPDVEFTIMPAKEAF